MNHAKKTLAIAVLVSAIAPQASYAAYTVTDGLNPTNLKRDNVKIAVVKVKTTRVVRPETRKRFADGSSTHTFASYSIDLELIEQLHGDKLMDSDLTDVPYSNVPVDNAWPLGPSDPKGCYYIMAWRHGHPCGQGSGVRFSPGPDLPVVIDKPDAPAVGLMKELLAIVNSPIEAENRQAALDATLKQLRDALATATESRYQHVLPDKGAVVAFYRCDPERAAVRTLGAIGGTFTVRVEEWADRDKEEAGNEHPQPAPVDKTRDETARRMTKQFLVAAGMLDEENEMALIGAVPAFDDDTQNIFVRVNVYEPGGFLDTPDSKWLPVPGKRKRVYYVMWNAAGKLLIDTPPIRGPKAGYGKNVIPDGWLPIFGSTTVKRFRWQQDAQTGEVTVEVAGDDRVAHSDAGIDESVDADQGKQADKTTAKGWINSPLVGERRTLTAQSGTAMPLR